MMQNRKPLNRGWLLLLLCCGLLFTAGAQQPQIVPGFCWQLEPAVSAWATTDKTSVAVVQDEAAAEQNTTDPGNTSDSEQNSSSQEQNTVNPEQKISDPGSVDTDQSSVDYEEEITAESFAQMALEAAEAAQSAALAAVTKDNSNDLETTAKAAVLIDAVGGQQLYSQNADEQLPMASVTKIMTMLLATEAVENGLARLTDIVTASAAASEMGGSQIYLEPGEKMSYYDLLVSIAAGSANDSCVAVAEYLSGSHEAFVRQMNEKAAELGLQHTHFANANGLPAEEHYTSAADMAAIMKEAMSNDLFQEITSIKTYDLRGGAFVLNNTNKMLWWYEGTLSGKTGWTNEAGYCLATCVERHGLRLIAVVLGVPETKGHFRESMKIYDYGFARYEAVHLAQAGEQLADVAVNKGEQLKVAAVTATDGVLITEKGSSADCSSQLDLPDSLAAPVAEGQVLGQLLLIKEGKQQATVPLLAESSVERASVWQELGRAWAAVLDF